MNTRVRYYFSSREDKFIAICDDCFDLLGDKSQLIEHTYTKDGVECSLCNQKHVPPPKVVN